MAESPRQRLENRLAQLRENLLIQSQKAAQANTELADLEQTISDYETFLAAAPTTPIR